MIIARHFMGARACVNRPCLNNLSRLFKFGLLRLDPGQPGGYITLISILVAGAIGLVITVSSILLGLNSSQTSLVIEQSNQAKALANACAEEALEQIRDDDSFVGTGDLSLGQGDCSYSVSGISPNKTIQAVGASNTVARRVKIIINQIYPVINISSWQEVVDF